jgi:CubicO group peptidase (beta-lactamase class C family)
MLTTRSRRHADHVTNAPQFTRATLIKLRNSRWKTPTIFPSQSMWSTQDEELRLHGLPRRKRACWSPALQVHGAPVFCFASHQQHMTTKAKPIRAKIPILIICFGALCMTRRRGAWVEWPGTGVFSTAHDVSIYAQALLDRLADRPSKFPLKQATLEFMTTPEQPGHTAQQLDAANDAAREAIAKTPNTTDPLLAPNYPAIKGQNLRGFGWDIDTAFSTPRGMIFPIGSFGHTGFTGTTLWMDPGSDTYVILLANAIHPRDNPPISNLRGEVATATAQALRLYSSASSATTSTPAHRTPR